MTKIEALELELAARKMVEGTAVKWKTVIRLKETKQCFYPAWARNHSRDEFELALGIVEGKPVWEGDILYHECGNKYPASKHNINSCNWSWNPPKPKTVMVELTVEDAEAFGNEPMFRLEDDCIRIAEACRKALEGVK